MKTRTKVLFIALTVVTAIVLFTASSLRAGTNNNASGSMWSSNIGWISLNNCTDAADSNTCTGYTYGVTIDPITGTVSGTAWSSNIGWITFNDAGCPTSGCTAGARFNSVTSTVEGWARACSVFASGCSGALSSNTGGWDGFLSLSGSGYGLTLGALNGTTRTINGSIWGSEVLGWIAVQGDAKVTTTPTVDLCLDILGNQDQAYLTQQGLTRDTDGNCLLATQYCPNSPYTHIKKNALPPGYTMDSNGQCVPPGGLDAACQPPYQAYFRNNLPSTLVIDPVTGDCTPTQKNLFCPNGTPKPSNGICPDCTDASCTQVTKRCPDGATPVNNSCPNGTGGGGTPPGGGGGTVDVCPNIIGVQLAAPAGYTIDGSNQCVPIGYPDLTTDWCPNIADIQLAIPGNMTVNPQGSCVAVKKPIFIEF